jgi:hypothetical protein
MMIKIISIELRGGYRLLLRFSDGSEGERDFSDLIEETGPLVKPLRDLTGPFNSEVQRADCWR